ncbi:MAG: acetate--CoA ligase [Gloeobacterales cyanobacterium]
MVIESVAEEGRTFEPHAAFVQQARINSKEKYDALYKRSMDDPDGFWGELAAQELHWFKPWDKVLQWDEPTVQWFAGGQLNISYNCLDRHLAGPRRHKAALVWEGEPGDSVTLTYAQLHHQVCLFANTLKKLGVEKGDRVAIYMPMVPETAVAMLACARIGAVHSVVFGGFSAEALKGRLLDAGVKVVITADGGWRRGNIVPLKANVDQAIQGTAVESVLVVRRTAQKIDWHEERDYWWHELQQTVSAVCPAEPMDSEDMLFILYTSGTTGKPKGVVHTIGGYNLYTHITSQWLFDLKATDLYWCTADVGWITGHSYTVYGPLSNGATSFMYEGAPNFPDNGRFWQLIEKYGINILYTAPTAIRAFMKWGEDWPDRYDLSSLRLLGTVGEPINPEAWMWYFEVIGAGKGPTPAPIVDTWWMTETGGHMLATFPGAHTMRPGYAGLPFPGVEADVVDREGNSVPVGEGGYLVIKRPWPSMIRTIYGNPQRYRQNYWEQVPGVFFTGDGAVKGENGYFKVLGRVDDVLSVSGHRLGTMEIESALVSHPMVAEAAVVGKPDAIKGESICAYVTLNEADQGQSQEELIQELKKHVANQIGAIARPDEIHFTEQLPKTRSGKIMRRLLRSIASGEEIVGDMSTLEDRSVLDKLRGR